MSQPTRARDRACALITWMKALSAVAGVQVLGRVDRVARRSSSFSRKALNVRPWRTPRLQPKTAFSRLSPVHRADLEGQQRVCAVKGGAFQWVRVPPAEADEVPEE